ncbi:MAG: DUF6017 domain-containing protein [Frisingicoccus sp.]
MAVFRVEKNHNYTVMSNYHLRDTALTLKAIGLGCPECFLQQTSSHHTTRGLAAICKEGVDAIGAALKELEARGYLVRRQIRDSKGRITDTEYTIDESPHTPLPDTASPDTENPYLDTPDTDEPDTEKPAQLNKDRRNKEKEIPTNLLRTYQILIQSIPQPPCRAWDMTGWDTRKRERSSERILSTTFWCRTRGRTGEQLDEVVDLIAETLCSRKKTIVIAGDEYPAEMVKEELLRITASHIEYVFDCLKQNTTYVRNIKKYVLASLFNAPSTIGSYYSGLVNHDMYGDGLRGR